MAKRTHQVARSQSSPVAAATKRLSVDEAFQWLAPHCENSFDACERLEQAIRNQRVKLWGRAQAGWFEVTPTFFKTSLCINAYQSPNGWHAELKMLEAINNFFETEWAMSAKDIELMCKPSPAPAQVDYSAPVRRRGPVLKHDWHAIDGEIARRCHDNSGRIHVPKSESKLAGDILQWCEDMNRPQPSESEMREAVKAICAALRKV